MFQFRNWLRLSAFGLFFLLLLCNFTIASACQQIGGPGTAPPPVTQNYYGQNAVTLHFFYTDDCRDIVHIMWAVPGGNWEQIDFDTTDEDWGVCIPYNGRCQANMSKRVGARLDKPYLFKFQSCDTVVIGPDECSDWSKVAHYLPSGPDTCIDGFVWRVASPTDHTCVAPASKDEARKDNALAASRSISEIRGIGGKCLDAEGISSANGTKIILWDCWGGPNQRWSFNPDGSIRGIDGKCLDAEGISSADGAKIILWDCWGGPNQRWSFNPDGSIRGIGGKCLDAEGISSANGTKIILWDCWGGPNQKWSTVKSSTCVQGFVWREAFPNDLVCVLPQVRDRTREENNQAWRHFARNWS